MQANLDQHPALDYVGLGKHTASAPKVPGLGQIAPHKGDVYRLEGSDQDLISAVGGFYDGRDRP